MAEKKKRRSRAEIAAEYGTVAPEPYSWESEVEYFRRLAKEADQRMVRLEKAAGVYVAKRGQNKGQVSIPKKGFENVLSYAYRQAINDIQTLSGKRDATRFNTVLKKNKSGQVNQTLLHSKINAVKRFLEAPTSMTSTIKEMYQKRADKINEKYGTTFTWQELGRFFESAGYDKLRAKLIASDVILKQIGKMQKNVDPKAVKAGADQNIRVSEDKVVAEVGKIIKDNQLTLKDFGL